MQIIASILAIATIAAAAATPNMQRRTARVELESRQAASLCGPLDTPQCCSTDVLGVADLACTSVPNTVTTSAEFTSHCAAQGKQPECCTLSLLNTAGVLCSAPAS